VAIYTVEKAIELGAKVVTLSDSSGFIYDPSGIDRTKLESFVTEGGSARRISEYARSSVASTTPGRSRGAFPATRLPSATENEIDDEDAKTLVENGVIAVGEGRTCHDSEGSISSSPPSPFSARQGGERGGVAVSGSRWPELDAYRMDTRRGRRSLHGIMENIQRGACNTARKRPRELRQGRRRRGFVKVADAMLAYGIM